MRLFLLQMLFTTLSISCMAQVSGSIELPTVCSPSDLLVAKINLDKGDVSGVGKLELQIPAGLEFNADGVSAGATVRHSDGLVKFLWVELPIENQLEVTFKVKATSTTPGIQTINGTFSYRNNGETRVDQLPYASIEIVVASEKEVVAESDNSDTSISASNISSVVDESEPEKSDNSQSATPTKTVVNDVEVVENAQPDKEYDKALFHVQLASSKIALTPEGLKTRFNTAREIIVISYEGGYKYAVGQLMTYEAAKKLCKEAKTAGEFSDCFVTSSFKGNHIPLQDAIKMNR